MHYTSILVLLLLLSACATQQTPYTPPKIATSKAAPFENTDLAMTVDAVLGSGHEQTLIEDPGWIEIVMAFENRSATALTVTNVQLLNQDGRYLDSASSYEQIIAPPSVSGEVAKNVATTSAGLVVGHFIPYGSLLTNAVTTANSTTNANTRSQARGTFALRALKSVELAPAGKMRGSAYLPNIDNAAALTIEYSVNGQQQRIQIPIPPPPAQAVGSY